MLQKTKDNDKKSRSRGVEESRSRTKERDTRGQACHLECGSGACGAAALGLTIAPWGAQGTAPQAPLPHSKWYVWLLCGLALGILLAGSIVTGQGVAPGRPIPPDYPRVTFRDVTERAGIHFRHFQGVRNAV